MPASSIDKYIYLQKSICQPYIPGRHDCLILPTACSFQASSLCKVESDKPDLSKNLFTSCICDEHLTARRASRTNTYPLRKNINTLITPQLERVCLQKCFQAAVRPITPRQCRTKTLSSAQKCITAVFRAHRTKEVCCCETLVNDTS